MGGNGIAGYRWYNVGNGVLGRGTSWEGGRRRRRDVGHQQDSFVNPQGITLYLYILHRSVYVLEVGIYMSVRYIRPVGKCWMPQCHKRT